MHGNLRLSGKDLPLRNQTVQNIGALLLDSVRRLSCAAQAQAARIDIVN